LARLLAHRRGAESRALLLDEIEYLDDEGLAALAEILRGLQGEFDLILIVSHAAGLRDAFDQAIEITKDGNSSEVVS
jgi:DNA repair exonuclease SbcCD ATPase subunit